MIHETMHTSGQPLEPALRASMESQFGCSFSEVRIHVDDLAAASAQALKAEAYTVGSHIFFAARRYNPATPRGQWLLAHELAHVVQQQTDGSTAPVYSRLEEEANDVADWVVSGLPQRRGVRLTPAPRGFIQCHNDVTCPGIPISAGAQAIWLPANEVIETAYKEHPNNRRHLNALFFGSQFENRDVLPPSGVPNRRFAETLLRRLRGLQNQRRPDIIDFQDRVFYEIKSIGYARQGSVQVASYYIVADEIRREYAAFAEPPWKVEYATWYPPHVLPFPTDPLNKIVCTQATDHNRYPGLILYEVRELTDDEKRRRRQARAHGYELWNFDQGFAEILPMIRNELPNAVQSFDPEYPNYVILVPQDLYWAWYQPRTDQLFEKMKVKPPFLDPKHPIGQFHIIAGTATLIAAGAIAAWGVVAAASTLFAASAVAATTIAEAGAAEIVSLAAYRAMLSAPAAKALAAAAGVLLVIGSAKQADAASAKDFKAIRAVALADFRFDNGIESATKTQLPVDKIQSPEMLKGKFAIGTRVLFDGTPHVIIGQISAR
jgi:hypothetical protein